jgi:hypothetical protein
MGVHFAASLQMRFERPSLGLRMPRGMSSLLLFLLVDRSNLSVVRQRYILLRCVPEES